MGAEIDFLLWIQRNIRNPILNPVMVFITNVFGGVGVFWILITLLLFVHPKTRRTGIAAAIALVVQAVAVNLIVKPIVARPRPYDACTALVPLVKRLWDYSFPSGHTACAFSVAAVCFVKLKKRYGVPLLVIAILVALSRMYVGVHYPTDVLGGLIFGLAAAWLGCFIVRKKIPEKK